MDYEKFKVNIVEGLKDYYGKSAEVDICGIRKNNGQRYDGIRITRIGKEYEVIPVINLDSLYEAYESGNMEMTECIEEICRKRESLDVSENMAQFTDRLLVWDSIKDNIYPILLSTRENEEILKDLISTPMLDLSVFYVIRMKISEEEGVHVKISRQLLARYGKTSRELHEQAMKNLEKDGYEFQDMDAFIKNMFQMEELKTGHEETDVPVKMYILTNSVKLYGAAGILNKKLIREFAGKKNFFILPSSIHETIFVPESELSDKNAFDKMVAEVNEVQVSVEERLADHSYYYDAAADEIRICA